MARKQYISVKSHEDLQSVYESLKKNIDEDPKLGLLFLINPVLAFERAGISLSEAMKKHVLHTLAYSPKIKNQMDRLSKKIEEKTGVDPGKASGMKQLEKRGKLKEDVEKYKKLRLKKRLFRDKKSFQKYASGTNKLPWNIKINFTAKKREE